jgi:hypothetical protein
MSPVWFKYNLRYMKKYISITAFAVFGMAYSQVIIGDDIGTAANKTSVLLDFAKEQNKGLVLPYVRTIPSGSGLVEGTIILDASSPSQARVKFYNGTWKDLSGQNGDVTSALTSQPAIGENTEAKAIIGANASSAEGVLVLESTSKAMMLPIVNSTDDVPKPAPGMMVYINKSGAKRLAVFNGSKWSYWKP